MAVGYPRTPNPYGPPPFFGPDGMMQPPPPAMQAQVPQPLGFQDIAGVGSDHIAPEPVQLIDPIQPGGGAPPMGAQTPQEPQGDYPSEASIERRMKLAKALMGEKQEVNHPLQAVANAVSQIGGAYLENKAAKDQESLEKRRRDAYKKALGGGTRADLNTMADQLIASDDPELVDKGLQIKLQIALGQGKRAGKPTQMIKGDDIVYVDEDGNEVEGYGGPRYKPDSGGSGRPDSYQKNDQVLLEGEDRPRPARFNPRTGPEYLGDDGQWKAIPATATQVTASVGAPISRKEIAKLDDQIMELQESIQYFEDYSQTRGGARQGIAFATDSIMANAKTLFGGQLTPEQIATLKSKGEFAGILGLFRTAVLGPGVMTQADREFLEEALGQNPNAFQNKEVMQSIVDRWIARRRHRLQQLQTRRGEYSKAGTDLTEPEAPPSRDALGSTPLPQGVPPKDKRPKGTRVTKGGKTFEWTGTGWREVQ